MKYVAFLRGINVGGNTKVEMGKLRKILEALRFANVKTVLNSGNVVFESTEKSADKVSQIIENELEGVFGFPISIILRTGQEIEELIKSNPFKHVAMTPQTKLNVTFLSQEARTLEASKVFKGGNWKIVHMTDKEVCTAMTVLPSQGTPELMKMLENTFGKNITTRTWNTVQKLAQV